ncbi:MAG: rRNA maturation RNase YbeY [Oscillospiraceae bacterium]|nr:rRNA maturation RNase YbeY [Oscillospiraceae bacterium]
MSHKVVISREKHGLGHFKAEQLIRKSIKKALTAEGIYQPCTVSVMLTDDDGIHSVNREFRGVDRATDVLSFPFNELTPGEFDESLCERDPEDGSILLGDMMISLEHCEVQGKELGHGFEREVCYLTVHSVLHLLGYDHVDEGEMKARMRAREKDIMGDS